MTTLSLKSNLSPEQISRAVRVVREIKKREKRRAYYRLFPEDGPLSRHNYSKHMEFFKAGSFHKERLFMAGNRCVTPWTFVQTVSGERLASEAFFGLGGNLQSWGGDFECAMPPSGAFLRSIEPAFRVVLDNGAFFDCSRKHQVLTSEGWLSLDQLVSLSSGLHCSYKLEDYQASCVEGGYLNDRPLLARKDSGQELPRTQGGAHKHSQMVFSRKDAEERTPQYIHAYLRGDHLSSRDALSHVEALSEMFAAPSVCSPVLPLTGKHQAFVQLALALNDQSLSVAADVHHLPFSDASGQKRSLSRVCEGRLVGLSEKGRDHLQLDMSDHPHLFVEELSQSDCRLGIFYPSKTPQLTGGRLIVSVIPIGWQPLLDVQVEGTNNYKSGGVYHHNCGKTESGGYETTAHLTGLYPDWWEGHRFDKPIMALAAGDTGQTTRDVIQTKLFGGIWDSDDWGTGIIPGDCLDMKPVLKQGVPKAYEEVQVKHVSGGYSTLKLRSYDQGRRIFQGFELDWFWADEEIPKDVYDEGLMRTMTTGGLTMMTFTPLNGLTELVLSFMESMNEQVPIA